jgi:hypothetical protein
MHWVLSAALYFDQFSARVLSAACSSARQDSLVRPTAMAYPAAALQLGETSSLGGLSASAIAGSPSIRTTTAILLAEADIVRGLTLAVSAPRWLYVPALNAELVRGVPCLRRLRAAVARAFAPFLPYPPRRAHQRQRGEGCGARIETPAPDRRGRSRGYTREARGSGDVRAHPHNHRKRDSFAAIGEYG